VRTAPLALPATDVSVNQAPLEPDAKRGAYLFDSINCLFSFLIKELIFVIGLRFCYITVKKNISSTVTRIRSTLLPNRDQREAVKMQGLCFQGTNSNLLSLI
jgi:hypothetical protein